MLVEDVHRRLRVLSKRHSMEILSVLFIGGKKYVSQLGEELGLPYATIQQRINELEGAGLVKCSESLHPLSKRPIKEVEVINFQMILSPRIISQIVTEEGNVREKKNTFNIPPSQRDV